jgi:CDP-diacylglycerol pyrophosphatase
MMCRLYLASLLLLSSVIGVPAQAASPDALWQIAHEQCLPNSIAHGNPAPCALVDREHGFVLLKDINGVAQHLLIPTTRLAGIESRELLSPDAPNYWRQAWERRDYVSQALGKSLAPDQFALEVNSAAARSQLQLHIHMDCVRPDLPALLQTHRDDPFGQWQPLQLDGHTYSILRLPADALATQDPFKLAATRSPYAARAMAAQSLLLTGARFADGSSGFYLLNMPVNFALQEQGSAEVLLDHDCRIVG